MARKTKAEKHADILEEARIRFDRTQAANRDERQQCLDDRRFYSIAGAMWEGRLGEQFENRPKLEVNKAHLSVIRIISEYRQNRITVNFSPTDGTPDDALADLCNDLYRASEQFSGADEAYDNAFEEAAGGGIGGWRLTTEYVDEYDPEDETQRICIEPIYDADATLWFDPDAKKQSKSDARYGFVMTAMDRLEYEETYNDSVASWPEALRQNEFDWHEDDVVYICEYYIVEESSYKEITYEMLDGETEIFHEDDLTDDRLDELDAIGATETTTRKLKERRVRKYIMSGAKILEDCGVIAGKEIPLVPCYGKRWFVDNIERAMGHVRLSKDPSRLYNMQISRLAEISAEGVSEKPIFTPEQIAGHEREWAEDNVKQNAFLLINPITDHNGQKVSQGPVDYTRTAQIPQALAALMQMTDSDIKELTGSQEAGEKLAANVSGDAIELVQNRLDMQTFIYMSNFAKAMKRSGEIWLSMAKDIYADVGRKMKAIDNQGASRQVELMKPSIGENGETILENDISGAKMDISVDVGPSSSTKRGSLLKAIVNMMQMNKDPQELVVLNALAMMNMEGEGLGDVRDYYRKKLVQMGVIKPNEEEAQQMAQAAANAQPSPEEQFLLGEATKAQAQAQKAEADTVKTLAETEKVKAETVETLAGIDRDDRQQALDAVNAAAKEIGSE